MNRWSRSGVKKGSEDTLQYGENNSRNPNDNNYNPRYEHRYYNPRYDSSHMQYEQPRYVPEYIPEYAVKPKPIKKSHSNTKNKTQLKRLKMSILLFLNVIVSLYALVVLFNVPFEFSTEIGLFGNVISEIYFNLYDDFCFFPATVYLMLSIYCFLRREKITGEYFLFYFILATISNSIISVIFTLLDINTGILGNWTYAIFTFLLGNVGLTIILLTVMFFICYWVFSDGIDYFLTNMNMTNIKNKIQAVKVFDNYDNDYCEDSNLKNNYLACVNNYSKDKTGAINRTLENYGVKATIANIIDGHSIVRYEITPSSGVKISSIKNLHEEIALSLGVSSVDITTDNGFVCIDAPKSETERTSPMFDEISNSQEFKNTSCLELPLGKNIKNKTVFADISEMPHLLIAGTTGGGKSILLHTIIVSLLLKNSPDQLKLVLIDPKVVEFTPYCNVPHLLYNDVINDVNEAIDVLDVIYDEMRKRYETFSSFNVRDLIHYNDLQEKRGALVNKLPHIIIIIDELAELMDSKAKEFENILKSLSQLARAAGIYLIVATQHPIVETITSSVKANIPSRIALVVSSGTNSKVILGRNGAENLIGKGDMLYKPKDKNVPERLQGYYLDIEAGAVDNIVSQVCEKYSNRDNLIVLDKKSYEIKEQLNSETNIEGAKYDESLDGNEVLEDENTPIITFPVKRAKKFNDRLTKIIIDHFVSAGEISGESIRSQFSMGAERAKKILMEMEEIGIIASKEVKNSPKPNKFLITQEEWKEKYSKQYQ